MRIKVNKDIASYIVHEKKFTFINHPHPQKFINLV